MGASGELLFTNYPTKPGRIWALKNWHEVMLYETPKATQDIYGVAVSQEGDVYFSSPYTGEILKLSSRGGVFSLYQRKSKNVGCLAFAPNGTLFMAELIPTEGCQSVFKLVPQGFIGASGLMAEEVVFTAPTQIGGIAFNSKGELFYSDGPRGRLWKVVNGTSVLCVDEKGEYLLSQIPAASITLLVDTGVEKRTLFLQLNKSRVEASIVFLFSTSTVALTVAVLMASVIIIPRSRRRLYRLVKTIPKYLSSLKHRMLRNIIISCL